MWIVACDDDGKFGNEVIKSLKEIVPCDDQITLFNNGIELIEAAYRSKQPIDLVLLDIEMPGLSGIEAARELREISPGTVIVIITGFIQYALKCYEIRAFNYLLKPIDPAKLKNTINEVRNKKDLASKNTLHIETRESHVFIPFCDLLYVESYRRALYAYTRGTSYKYYEQISKVDKELAENGFYRIHMSYIVNLSHIKRVDKTGLLVILSTGKELPIGKRKIKGLVSLLIDVRRKFDGTL